MKRREFIALLGGTASAFDSRHLAPSATGRDANCRGARRSDQ